MTFIIVNAIANILSGIKLNKIPDKDTKEILVKDYLDRRRKTGYYL